MGFQIFVILSIISGSILQVVNRDGFLSNEIESIVVLMMHVDALLMFFMLPRVLFFGSIKNQIKTVFNYKILILMIFPICGTYFKNYLLTKYSPQIIAINALIIPFFVSFISSILLNEKYKVIDFAILGISVIGFFIANGGTLENGNIIYIMLLFSIIFSIGLVVLRWISLKTKTYMSFSIIAIYYGIFSFIYLMYNGNFNYEILISKYSIYGVILISLQQIFYIISNKKSSNILSIEVVNYLRVIIVSLLCYFQFLEVPSIEKYIGCFVILIAVILNAFIQKRTK
jgi:hypothetical protein